MTSSSRSILTLLVSMVVAGLSGCAHIPGLPTQHIVMFDGTGHPVDPTGNLGCPEGEITRTRLCNEERRRLQDYHTSLLDHPRLDAAYYRDAYIPHILGCLGAHFEGGDPRRCPASDAPPRPDPTAPRRVLIFIHGGLNSQVSTLQRVTGKVVTPSGRSLYREIVAAGYYPLFVNWQSDLRSSYVDQLLSVRQGERRPWVGGLTAPFVLGVDVARSVARLPLVWAAQIGNDLGTTPPITASGNADADRAASELVCAYQYADWPECRERFEFRESPLCLPWDVRRREPPDYPAPRLSGDAQVFPLSVGEDRRECGDMGVALLSYVLTLPTRFLISPFLDTLGTSAWENMLRRVHLLFNLEEEFQVADTTWRGASDLAEQHARAGGVATIPRSGGLAVFLTELSRYLEGSGGEWEITVVGHSMGAIVLNEMLREVMQRRLTVPIKNVVYLGAAATVRDFQDTVIPYLRHRADARFFNLTLHPIAEQREAYKVFGFPVDPAPRGSLLVMIDNFLAKPLTVLDRTAGRYENFVRALHTVPLDLRGRIHLKTFSVGDGADVQRHSPQRHSDLAGRFRYWTEPCWFPEAAMGDTAPETCTRK